jgi:hypothetical protein
MLSLGLVLAFSAQAFAVDVQFSGSFYVAGMYQDKVSAGKNDVTVFSPYGQPSAPYYINLQRQVSLTPLPGYYLNSLVGLPDGQITTYKNNSTAFYYQRLRVQTDFIVSPGLKLVTRFDALERIWGGARGEAYGTTYSNGVNDWGGLNDGQSAATRTESQNIAFDIAYVSYTSPIGLFTVGYKPGNGWGTVFGNGAINGPTSPGIGYVVPVGPVYIAAGISKGNDASSSAVNPNTVSDADNDTYSLAAIWVVNKDISMGLSGAYQRTSMARAALEQDPYILPVQFFADAYFVSPYIKAKFGPIFVEGEVNYLWGVVNWEGNRPLPSYLREGHKSDIRNISAYLNAGADFGMVYGGGTVAYVSGDDPKNDKDVEGAFLDGGLDYNPCLIMFNSERSYWAGRIPGYGYTNSGMILGSSGPKPMGGPMNNALFGQGKIGVRPIPALDINASLAYATVSVKPTGALNADYGWEADLTSTYKITNNLSYMLGVGYWFVGNYYKGTSNANEVSNNYILINKLTLTF